MSQAKKCPGCAKWKKFIDLRHTSHIIDNTMKKILISSVLLLSAAFGVLKAEDLKTGPWFNHYVNGINRLPARVTSYSYQSEADALTYNRDLSRVTSLNGT